MHELFVTMDDPWDHADLTAIAGSPAAPGASPAGYAWKGGCSKQVVYLTSDGHVHELWVRRFGSWSHADLTAMTNAPAAVGPPLSGYGWYTGGTKQVMYRGTSNGHVHELFV
ncbi:MAG TPA: hypothetical protein VMJ75_30565 [Candidatus Acidoferrales bacterium]|nr:hypothetical protein [Candidatus Acidoferrales bacterium]